MRDIIKDKLNAIPSIEEKYNLLREYLQALVLKFIEEKGYIRNVAFVGGTALRFLYDLKRFSEDLDFSLVSKRNFDFGDFLHELGRSFEAWNIKIEFKPKTKGAVANSFLKFPDLMQECGITARKDEKLFIKVEIDCNPPAGFGTEVSFNQKYMPMSIFHFDLPSLFAGKLHAVLMRQYTKGRDIYDLMWFLGKKTEPNFSQLENAIEQTTGKKPSLTTDVLRQMLIKKISETDFKKVHSELQVFLADKSELQYLTAANLKQSIEKM